MAALQSRNGSFRLLFQHDGKQHTLTVGRVPLAEARQWKSRAENLLMRLRQNLLELPRGVAITDFIAHDGKPPPVTATPAAARNTTLDQLRQAYLATFSNGAIEASTVDTAKIHLTHLEATYGKRFTLAGLSLPRLQDHVTRRQKVVTATTIKKEVDTFRAVWNWGRRMNLVDMPWPAGGLVYPKTEEKLPFMTWEEIERRVKAGDDAETLWECLYLSTAQIAEFMAYAKTRANVPAWVYPMLATAAHTGARRSEMMRARLEDVDLPNAVITIREKKRARGARTSRRVPVSRPLAEALGPQVAAQAGKVYLFGDGQKEVSDPYAHKMFDKLVRGSKWAVVKGWHALRHSFISALACQGIDQRIIDDFVGHSTEEQRRRYRHLFPAVTQAAIAKVFG